MKMKVVGKRKDNPDKLIELDGLQKLFNQIKSNRLIPKGVYKFLTFEEADEWMIKKIASTHADISFSKAKINEKSKNKSKD